MEDKPFKSVGDLVSLLVDSRKLVCDDAERKELANYLRIINYYRFTGYARQFQRDPKYGNDQFVDGASFQEIKSIIETDALLRQLLFKQLSAIEIAVRSVLAHELGRAKGNTAFYLDESSYLNLNGKPESIVESIVSDLSRCKAPSVARYVDPLVSKDDFDNQIKRYRNVPIWVAVEVMSFGRISNMIEYLADSGPVKAAAGRIEVQWSPFSSVIHSLSVLRNICCHHGQIWHRRLDIQCPVQPKLRQRYRSFDKASAYAAILMANHYREKIDGDVAVASQIEDLLDNNQSFAEGICKPNPK